MCQPPAWQKNPGGIGKQERAKEIGSENNAVLHTMWRLKAMVPRKARAHCSVVRLAEGRESLGGQLMAEILILPLSGCWAFVLDGTKRLQDCQSSRLYRLPKDAT